jgi:hypothetical protein
VITRNAEYDRIMDIDASSSKWTAKMLFKVIHPDDVRMVREKRAWDSPSFAASPTLSAGGSSWTAARRRARPSSLPFRSPRAETGAT